MHVDLLEIDVRRVKEIIEDAGYPYEQYQVVTEDGYILLLERIPNRTSKHVLYLQHGVSLHLRLFSYFYDSIYIFDSAFAWIATGTGALAFRSHDQGQ